MKKYIATRPETVTSLVQSGCLPTELPAYLTGIQLRLFDTSQQALEEIRTSFDQAFILELNIHPSYLQSNKIPTESIEKIICYSERGKNLVTRLLKEIKHPLIEINPAYFPLGTSIESPTKKAKVSLIRRLSTPSEHTALLLESLRKARKKLLITSYDMSHTALQNINFYYHLQQALSRGVKIYIYYNDIKSADAESLINLRILGVLCDKAPTHSKLLCVDDQWVSIGSYNWLALHPARNQSEKNEGTIICYDKGLNAELLQHIWDYLKFYRHLQHGNRREIHRFEANVSNESTIVYSISPGSELEYIPTLEQHCGFFQEILMKTKRKLVICSPFLSMKQCLEDIRKSDLVSLSQRGVQIFFITSSRNQDYQKFSDYLSSIQSKTLYLIDHYNFHLKTLIIDDEIIAEGSFNWLSASRYEDGDFHNHEATLLVRGEIAVELINDFYQSPIGQKIRRVAVGNTLAPAVAAAAAASSPQKTSLARPFFSSFKHNERQ